MSKSATWNFSDTALTTTILAKAANVLNTAVWPNFEADFVKVSDEPTESVVSNTKNPIGRPETFRFGLTDIADIYKNSSIEKSAQSPSKRGKALLVQVNDVLTVTESITGESYDLPLSAHVVFKFPTDAIVTATHLRVMFNRLQQALYDQADLTANGTDKRLSSLMRGSLVPKLG